MALTTETTGDNLASLADRSLALIQARFAENPQLLRIALTLYQKVPLEALGRFRLGDTTQFLDNIEAYPAEASEVITQAVLDQRIYP